MCIIHLKGFIGGNNNKYLLIIEGPFINVAHDSNIIMHCDVMICTYRNEITHCDITVDVPGNNITHWDVIMGHGTLK